MMAVLQGIPDKPMQRSTSEAKLPNSLSTTLPSRSQKRTPKAETYLKDDQ